jgi:hypothetical protein
MRRSRPVDRLVGPILGRHRVLAVAQLVVGLELMVLAMTSDVSFVARVAGVALGLVVGAALAASSASEGTVTRGLSAVVGGILGVSSGASIAGSWLVTAGLSPIALVALAALVAGSLLLVSGTWLLVRATPRWWRLMAIPIGFLVIQFGLLPLMAAVYGSTGRTRRRDGREWTPAVGGMTDRWNGPPGAGSALFWLRGPCSPR